MSEKGAVTRKKSPTQELLSTLLARLNRIDERLKNIEAAQDVTSRVYHSHGTAIESIEQRCLSVLSDKCPLLLNGNGYEEGVEDKETGTD